MKRLDDLDVRGKRVFIRVDFNVPLDKQQKVADDTRIRAALPTIKKVIESGGRAVLASHLGRPKGKPVPEMSLKPVAEYLEGLIGKPVPAEPDCIGERVKETVWGLEDGDLVMLENLRYHEAETKNDQEFARALAELAEVYVNDAFSCSHRAHASIEGIAHYVSDCAAGYQLQNEVEYFHKALENPERPLAVLIGGAKVSTKIGVLENIFDKADHVLIGGAMANTFLKAEGKPVGASLVENEYAETALDLLQKARESGVNLVLPEDAVVAADLDSPGDAREVGLEEVSAMEQILDVGPKTVERFKSVLGECRTVIWNGPLGAFEVEPFNKGTFEIAGFLGGLNALTVAGGGDSASALAKAGAADKVSYVSTAGGAFLELLEGKTLPGIAALEECGK
jgi:phosphoglycerate kinase